MNRPFILAIITSLIWGFAPMLEKIGLTGKMDPYLGVVVRTLPIAVISIFGLAFMGRLGELSTVNARNAIFIGAGGLVAGLIGQFVFYTALKNGEASVVVPIAATYPLVAFVVSAVFLGEPVTLQKVFGIALVVGGVAFLR